MHVNVFTYYENKLALKAAGKVARKRRRRAPKPRVARSGLAWYDTWACRGALAGLLAAQLLWFVKLREAVPPAVLGTLLACWGLILGMAVDWTLARLRKFVRALRGDRLSTDDVLVLAGRR